MLVPEFDAFYGAALAAVGRLPERARVLDLGAGTGLLSALLAARQPMLRLTLVDLSPGMLAEAARRFAAMGSQPPDLIAADYAEAMPEGPFHAVVSALSIHHLSDPAKRRVHAAAFARLDPGGVFVNAEQVAGRTPAEDAALDRRWEADARALGADDAMIARARGRMAHDRCAPPGTQLDWLRQAGFDPVAVPWAGGRFAVLAGRRPA